MTTYRFIESRAHSAGWIIDLEDAYLRERQGSRAHPRPVDVLIFELVGEDTGGGMVALTPPRELEMIRNHGGYYLFYGREVLPGDRRQALPLVEGRLYRLRVRGLFYQTLEFDVRFPMPERRVVPGAPDPWAAYSQALQAAATYPFPGAPGYRPEDDPLGCGGSLRPAGGGATRLRGGLYRPDGRGLARATITVVGRSNVYTVADDGQWVLWFPPDDPTVTGLHTVTITLPDGGGQILVPGVCVARGHETSLPATALRGRVMRRGVGVAGAAVAVAGFPDTVTSAATGDWWYYFLPNQADVPVVAVTVTLPDGATQTQNAFIRSRGTAVVPSFVFP